MTQSTVTYGGYEPGPVGAPNRLQYPVYIDGVFRGYATMEKFGWKTIYKMGPTLKSYLKAKSKDSSATTHLRLHGNINRCLNMK